MPVRSRLAVGCGAALLLTAAGMLVGYLGAALLATTGGAELVELSVLAGAGAALLAFFGLVVASSALVAPAGADDSVTGPRRSPLAWLTAFAVVLIAGRAALSAGPATGLLMPPLHFVAALIPALAITGSLATRRQLVGLAYGGCGAALAALVVEAIIAVPLGAAVYLALNASPGGQAALDGLLAALDAAGQGAELNPATLGRFALQPAVVIAGLGLVGLLGPFAEETVKLAGVAIRGPRDRAQAWSWGIATGAGFGLTEAVLLGAMGLSAWPATMVMRASAMLMHATMTGLAAVGWQQAVSERRWRRGLATLALATLGHGLWNSLVLAASLAGAWSVLGGPGWLQPAAAVSSTALVALFGAISLGFVAASRRHQPSALAAAQVSVGGADSTPAAGASQHPRPVPPCYTARPTIRGGATMTPKAYARADQAAATARLMDFLTIPSVSTAPERAADVQRAAEWVADRLRSAGARGVRVDQTAGHPVVFGEWTEAPDAPTVLVYGHYDVQPPDPEELWTTPPFEPAVRGGAVYARGASDDKGQLLIHLEALAAFTHAAGGPPVNLKYVIEGEEEIGSPHLAEWLHQHAGALAADVAVVSDTAMVAPGQPSIIYGLRGLAYIEVTVTGPPRDLHSGQFGGAVLNPAHALAQIIAQLHDAHGRVTVPGFYDRVRPLDDDERELLARVPFDHAAFRTASGDAGGWGDPDYTLIERLGARPTLDVNGLWSGWTGAGAKTVLPSQACAKISMRLVPDQDPAEIARRCGEHIQSCAPAGVSVTWRSLHGAPAAIIDRSLPAVAAAAKAYESAYGRAPVFAREGGTIPVVALLKEVLDLPTVMMGFGLPDDNLHAPNEKFDLENFQRGIEVAIGFLDSLPGLTTRLR